MKNDDPNSPEALAEATRYNKALDEIADRIAEGVLAVIREQANNHGMHPDDLLSEVIGRLDESSFTPEGKAAAEAFKLLPEMIKKLNEEKQKGKNENDRSKCK